MASDYPPCSVGQRTTPFIVPTRSQPSLPRFASPRPGSSGPPRLASLTLVRLVHLARLASPRLRLAFARLSLHFHLPLLEHQRLALDPLPHIKHILDDRFEM